MSTLHPDAAHLSDEVRAAARDGDPVAMTRVLVATPSVNPALEEGGAGEAAVAEQCARWLAEWGYDVETPEAAPGRPNVVARLRHGEGRTVLFNGHTDTVGVAGMTVEPFGAEIRGERLYGRGACDMKGGVAALLAAARTFAAGATPGELIVALTCDEEHASIGMAALVEDLGPVDAAVVCEPTSLAVMPAHKGFVWTELEFEGRAAHGSRPEVGIDAVRHCGRFLAALDRVEARLRSADRSHPLLGHGSLHAGTVRGGSAPSVYPERCVLVMERRTLPGEHADDAVGELRDLLDELESEIPGFRAVVRPGLDRPGTEVAPDHPLVRGLQAALEAVDLPPRIEGMTAWVDAAFLNEAGIPAVCFGPGSIAQAHAADEWIDVAEIRLCARVLEGFLAGVGR